VSRPSEPTGRIAEAIAGLSFDDATKRVDQAIEEGVDPMTILHECREGMERVGERYSTGEYFLSELIMSADIFKRVMEKLEPLLAGSRQGSPLGAVVAATPKGDIHDLGKNIVVGLFKVSGFDVFDLGVDVEPEAIVDKVIETGAEVVAMSALITPTFESMKKVVELLEARNLREGRFVIIGGGPTTMKVRDHVGADAWTLNPKEGINWCRDFVAGRRR
jgi:methylmalonyl-CoA mutase cobalamin-binding domain/chain